MALVMGYPVRTKNTSSDEMKWAFFSNFVATASFIQNKNTRVSFVLLVERTQI